MPPLPCLSRWTAPHSPRPHSHTSGRPGQGSALGKGPGLPRASHEPRVQGRETPLGWGKVARAGQGHGQSPTAVHCAGHLLEQWHIVGHGPRSRATALSDCLPANPQLFGQSCPFSLQRLQTQFRKLPIISGGQESPHPSLQPPRNPIFSRPGPGPSENSPESRRLRVPSNSRRDSSSSTEARRGGGGDAGRFRSGALQPCQGTADNGQRPGSAGATAQRPMCCTPTGQRGGRRPRAGPRAGGLQARRKVVRANVAPVHPVGPWRRRPQGEAAREGRGLTQTELEHRGRWHCTHPLPRASAAKPQEIKQSPRGERRPEALFKGPRGFPRP